MKGVVRKREEEKISLREMTNFQGCGGSERKGNLAALGDEPLGPTPAIQKAQLCAGLTGLAEARGFEPPVRLPAHTLSKRAP